MKMSCSKAAKFEQCVLSLADTFPGIQVGACPTLNQGRHHVSVELAAALSPFTQPLRLCDHLGERQSQSTRNGLCRIQIGASFLTFQQANIGLMKSCHFCQSGSTKPLFLTVSLDHGNVP